MTLEDMRRLDAVKTYKELEEAKARIKQLEEAGDKLASRTLPNGNSHADWRKAKEAKP